MSDVHLIGLEVNGVRHERAVDARTTLADFLRSDLGLTGTHVGCEHGICGSCTVLVDDVPTRSCVLFAVQADEAAVVTVEGLNAPDGSLTDLQEAMSRHHGLQCGFCTPGYLTLLHAFLASNPDPDDEAVREVVASNLCRCTGYAGICAAVKETATCRGRGDEERPR
jgi:aerobic-type carbon monoxide dehydrogenase small subunit (CoxS/CutS family)